MKRLAIVAAAVLFTNVAWAQPQYDLLLKGGHVIDPRNGIDAVMDVADRGRQDRACRRRDSTGRARKWWTSRACTSRPG